MITVETWQMFGGLAGIIILLGGVALALQRLGIIARSPCRQLRAVIMWRRI